MTEIELEHAPGDDSQVISYDGDVPSVTVNSPAGLRAVPEELRHRQVKVVVGDKYEENRDRMIKQTVRKLAAEQAQKRLEGDSTSTAVAAAGKRPRPADGKRPRPADGKRPRPSAAETNQDGPHHEDQPDDGEPQEVVMDDLHIPESIGTDTAEYRKLKQYLAEKNKKKQKFDPKKAPTGDPDEVPEDLRGRVQYFGHMFTREQLLGIVQNELRDSMRRRQPGRAREAANLGRDLAKQYYGKGSSIYAASLVGVAMAEKLDLNYALALKLLQEADDRYEAIYGQEHPFTARI